MIVIKGRRKAELLAFMKRLWWENQDIVSCPICCLFCSVFHGQMSNLGLMYLCSLPHNVSEGLIFNLVKVTILHNCRPMKKAQMG